MTCYTAAPYATRIADHRREALACKVPGLDAAGFARALDYLVSVDPWGENLAAMRPEAARVTMALSLRNLAVSYATTGKLAPVLVEALAVQTPAARDAEGAAAAASLTVEVVTDWQWQVVANYRGRVPAMPRAERMALAWLEEQRATRRLTDVEYRLHFALYRKLRYCAEREIERR